MKIKFEDSSLDRLMKKLDKIANESRLEKAHGDIGAWVRDDARLRAPDKNGELSQSIDTKTVSNGDGIIETEVFTNKEYAQYVEFGTGLKGQENHEGISPSVQPTYTQNKWWVSSEQFPDMFDYYPADVISTDKETGISYVYISGQEAQPFLYPALAENADEILKLFKQSFSDGLKEV